MIKLDVTGKKGLLELMSGRKKKSRNCSEVLNILYTFSHQATRNVLENYVASEIIQGLIKELGVSGMAEQREAREKVNKSVFPTRGQRSNYSPVLPRRVVCA